MPCYCEDNGGMPPDYIIAAAFGECKYGKGEITSVVFGWFSIICWIIATYPQMRMSFLLKRCEAISIAFLILWFIGDLLNLISLIVIDGLLTQIVLGALWLAMDFILNGQYFYYQHKNKGKDLPDQDVKAITRYRVPEIVIYTVLSAAVVTSFLCYAIPAGNYVRVARTLSNHDGLGNCSAGSSVKAYDVRWWVGSVMAYCTIPLYCFNRVLQVIKNCKKKEVDDLSMGLFILIMCANIFQSISIVVADPTASGLKSQAPYLFGAVFPVVMDALILSQILYYNKKNSKQKNGGKPDATDPPSSVEMSPATGTLSIPTIQ
ncbi:Seven transmembrane protein 1 [Giardia duodenalis]|uniref:Seven transmembrane protein 1 n=1 Tax=Giardia intestinalis (strain ATCC 50803 / WB clone C6) TaxID=184922 RepID=A8BZB0_GIAIC|nr:Seven transmembrane protein 1 [Giardia intestinalis]KAE8304596.1 Seven transmembrane protein 1 [Giardia intestinalis]|eukprot:XP_001704065.1 Seven transmembrane protein 1 [Giardia lamblia ATCC 50803]